MPLIHNNTPKGRPLLPDEVVEAKKVFGNRIDYSTVEVVSAPYYRLQKSTDICTPNGKIYWPNANTKKSLVAEIADAHDFIHEMVHVLQFQKGEKMKLSVGLGIFAHIVTATAFNPYKYRVGQNWKDYSVEQQAELVADAYCEGFSVFKQESIELKFPDITYAPHSFNAVNLETFLEQWVFNID